MGLEIYGDDNKTIPILESVKHIGPGTVFAVAPLVIGDISAVYKWNGSGYTKLTVTTHYTLSGANITLVTALTVGQHIILLPTNCLDMVFTGAELSIRTLTKRLVFFKNAAGVVYDALKLYSEDYTTDPLEVSEVLAGGYYPQGIDGTFNIYDAQSILISDGVGIAGFTTDWSLYNLYNCAVCLNGQYVGDCIGWDPTTIVLKSGTTLPVANGVNDLIEVFSTGELTFALSSLGGAIPADAAFTRMINLPTLTTAAPTAYVWMRESATIPSVSSETAHMPFKLSGQEYAG